MKNSFLLLFFLFLINCSSSSNLEIDVESLKKEGLTILKSKNTQDQSVEEISKIESIILYKNYININISDFIINEFKLFKYFNSSSNAQSLNSNNDAEFNKLNVYNKDLLYFNNFLILVDDEANLIFLDKDLKVFKKFQIHKKNKRHNYIFKFSLIGKNGILYVSDNMGSILAIDINAYKILWRNDFSVPFLSNLAISKNSIFVTNSNGKLFSFDLLTGKQNWSYETGTNTIKSDRSYKITILNNILVFTNDLGNLYAIDLNKRSILWNYITEYSGERTDLDVLQSSNLYIEDNFLYFSTTHGKLVKLDIIQGKQVWKNDFSSNLNLFTTKDHVIIINEEGYFSIFNKLTGTPLFKKNLAKLNSQKKIKNSTFKLNNLYASSEYIYVTTSNGYLIKIDSKNLQNIQYNKISDQIKSKIISINENFYFIGEKNYIYKIK